jgi:lipopolysaccharide transport system ATP-binding protein
MDPIISAENLGKKYRIGHQNRRGYLTLREQVGNAFKSLGRKEKSKSAEDFWAVKDLSFTINQGDTVGVIGRNGAGKSTLLKILSRITVPTTGKAVLRGRVASLLEIGTGFHPELTGRENILLNGAILGLRRAEIIKKFDDIVAFAEVEQFIDTPVKRYSSGMYLRLAFAVAAHLEPEILLVDEVLAVGDLQFQKKCLGRMEEISKEGRTVLFVSHNMQAIRQFCRRCFIIQKGELAADGDVVPVTEQYLKAGEDGYNGQALENVIRMLPHDPAFRLDRVELFQDGKTVASNIENGSPVEVSIRYQVLQPVTGLRIFIDIWDSQEILLFRSFHDEAAGGIIKTEPGSYCSQAVIPGDILGPIRYDLRIQAGIHNVRYCIPESAVRIPLFVTATGRYNRAYLTDTFRGKLALVLNWETKKENP